MPRLIVPLVVLLSLAVLSCSSSDSGHKDAAPPAGCELGEFDCGTGSECIDSRHVCDEVEQCSNGADEKDCGCGAGLYQCEDGQCIVAAFVCDNVVNCNDGSDEVSCP